MPKRIRISRNYSHFFSLSPGTELEEDENGNYIVKTGVFIIPGHIVESEDNAHVFETLLRTVYDT